MRERGYALWGKGRFAPNEIYLRPELMDDSGQSAMWRNWLSRIKNAVRH